MDPDNRVIITRSLSLVTRFTVHSNFQCFTIIFILLFFIAKSFQPSKEYVLYEWLRSKGLEHYVISFVESGIVDLTDVARLRLPDEDLYDELEIMLPGHKRRLERAGE